MRFFLYLSYKGTAYHGWQIQKNAPSVQETLQRALSLLLKEPVEVVGAGRTDTGVHASFYVAHFDTDNPAPSEDAEAFCYRLNCVLPHDIAVRRTVRVTDTAHARFDAALREYRYYLLQEKDPFRQETTWQYSVPLDVERMNEAAALLKEYADFTSFSKLHTDVKTHICRIRESFWSRQGTELVYTVSADRFLRNMVRAIVGTLVEVGRGKIGVSRFREIIEARSRGMAGTSAPAGGLFLTRVDYPQEIFMNGIIEKS